MEKGEKPEHPSREAIRLLFSRIDSDKSWFPGKSYQKRFGPKPVLTPAKRQKIATSAMAIKESGEEPTFGAVIQRCPVSTCNPVTKLPFSAYSLRKIFQADCYDVSPENPWRFQRCLQKTWLPQPVRDHRLAWSKAELRTLMPGVWYFNNLIWFDPCYTIMF